MKVYIYGSKGVNDKHDPLVDGNHRQVICCIEFCFSKKPHWQGGSKHGWGMKKHPPFISYGTLHLKHVVVI
jgi:hypothetical protein